MNRSKALFTSLELLASYYFVNKHHFYRQLRILGFAIEIAVSLRDQKNPQRDWFRFPRKFEIQSCNSAPGVHVALLVYSELLLLLIFECNSAVLVLGVASGLRIGRSDGVEHFWGSSDRSMESMTILLIFSPSWAPFKA